MIEIAPSIIAADYADLAAGLRQIEDGGADFVHVDVMDGHFVPNLTIGADVAACLSKRTKLPLDCHLMVEAPGRWIDAFLAAGASRISVHVESSAHLHKVIESIKNGGAAAGAAINPATPLSALDELLPELDFVLIMSVNPGFCGQAFIEASVAKVRRAANRIQELGLELPIQVDGGVDAANIGRLVDAGARSFVAGSSVFGSNDPAAAVRALRATVAAAS